MSDQSYIEDAASVVEAIKADGQPITLTREGTGGGVYDPNTSTTTDVADVVFNAFALPLNYKTGEVNGTSILVGDVRIYITPDLGTEPVPEEILTLTRDSTKYRVVNTNPLKPGGILLLLDVQARKAS